MSKIISKKPHHSGFEGWDIKMEDGTEWSVIDFGGKKWAKTYEMYPSEIYLNTYRGWEAYNGDVDEIIRADSYEEIEKRLLS